MHSFHTSDSVLMGSEEKGFLLQMFRPALGLEGESKMPTGAHCRIEAEQCKNFWQVTSLSSLSCSPVDHCFITGI